MKPSRVVSYGVVALLLLCGGKAVANQEGEDPKREIVLQSAGVSGLPRHHDRGMVTDEITNLRSWLDEAWAQYSKEEYKRVREVVDRCIAQAELIRQKITAGKMTAYANERDGQVRATREKIERTRK